LFNPPEFKPPLPPKLKLREKIKKNVADRKTMVKELDTVCKLRKDALELEGLFENVKQVDVIAAVRERVEVLAHWAELDDKGSKLKAEFKCLFEPMPHVDELPTDVLCQIKLKDTEKTFQSCSYQSPRKYKDTWRVLIQSHLDAGRIHPSSSPYASPAFLIPKADKSALPHWVNDYRPLNSNTEHDRFPLQRVDNILADCAKGKIWSTIDFTDSFFQTRMHPDSIPFTAVNTPLGLYEWLVMPQGL
jgi:hypothetical protein